MIRRRALTRAGVATLALPHLAVRAAPKRIFRVVLPAAETGFDPAQVGDLYSNTVNAHIFESLYAYDPLAIPVKPRPLTAAAMPEVSADFRTWTIRLQPGIRFADDPAFGGAKRELVAADYVYSIKRMFDPAVKSPAYSIMAEEGFLGLEALRQAAVSSKRPFDYDSDTEGLRALDRYTLQIKLEETRPRFILTLCQSGTLGAVAREVIERYAGDTLAHPVGTGSYRLGDYRRSSRIMLVPNENFRDLRYDAEPAADDAQGQAWLVRFKGRRVPFNDGVEISVIEESQPRWLSFLNGQSDVMRVPPEYTFHAAPTGTLAPHLAKRGITAHKFVNPDYTMSWFNMDDPLVGGYTPAKVALRRAIEMSYDIEREVRLVRRGQAMVAQALFPPGTVGYDPNFRTANADHDPARANALLDIYGYLDRDRDGWREQPDGRPLTLQMATQASQIERQFDETWEKSLREIGIKVRFMTAQWPENMKAARAGKLQMWALGSSATTPDGGAMLARMYSPSIGSTNLARARLPGFDDLYRRTLVMPDGPERVALCQQAFKIVVAYMPYRVHSHRVYTDLSHPWVSGWRQPLFRYEGWQYTEVDAELRERMAG